MTAIRICTVLGMLVLLAALGTVGRADEVATPGDLITVEIDSELPATDRAALEKALRQCGFPLLPERPAGFPSAGEPQEPTQSVWVLGNENELAHSEARATILAAAGSVSSSPPGGGLLGVLRVQWDPEIAAYRFYRPAHLVVFPQLNAPIVFVKDSLVSSSGLTQVPDSLRSNMYTKYLFRRVLLRTPPDADAITISDSLKRLSWIRWAGPRNNCNFVSFSWFFKTH